MTLTKKALLASLVLLAVPWLVLPWVGRFEAMLVATQQHAMESRAAMVATFLRDHPLVDAATRTEPAHGGEPLYAHRLAQWVETDGRKDDFGRFAPRTRTLSADDTLQVNVPYDAESLRAEVVAGTDGRNLFVHVAVTDERVVYREMGSLSVHRNDHVQLAVIDPEGNYRRYTIAPHQPGAADVFRITNFSQGSRALRPDEDIEAYWLATENGYNVEVRLPLTIVSSQFAISISDVDSEESRALRYSLGSASTTFEEDIGRIVLPDPELDALLESLAVNDSRLVLVDRNQRVLAEAGNIDAAEGIWADAKAPVVPLPFYRSTDTMVIFSAAKPVYVGDSARAAIAVEQNSRGMRRAYNAFVQSVVLFSLAFIGAGIALVFILTARFSHRIRALRSNLSASVDPQGRVRQAMPPIDDNDELGELGETFRQVTDRLHQYNRYLEDISRRLSHELRTPITVVSSSLDNLSMADTDANRDIYIERAREGVTRLSRILSSMSEATRLESSLNPEEVEYFDLASVIAGCVQGYEGAYPEQTFELSIEGDIQKILGLPDLVSQLMDKLVGNAVEFAAPGSAIRVRLTREDDQAVLRVINEGPGLPASGDHLFDSMISFREGEQAAGTHLGLGLYIARLIAEFHGGTIAIEDRVDTTGAVVTVRLPILRIKGTRP